MTWLVPRQDPFFQCPDNVSPLFLARALQKLISKSLAGKRVNASTETTKAASVRIEESFGGKEWVAQSRVFFFFGWVGGRVLSSVSGTDFVWQTRICAFWWQILS